MDLNELRQGLNELDDKLVKLFVERLEIVNQVAEFKRKQEMKIIDRPREEQILERLSLTHPAFTFEIRQLYEQIFQISRSLQEKQLGQIEHLPIFQIPQEKEPIYGLLGRKLSHSFSPFLHSQIASYPYRLYEVEPTKLADFLKAEEIRGLNVTIPYKERVMPYLDKVSQIAEKTRSVNLIRKNEQGEKVGHNTDYDGLLYAFKRVGISLAEKKVLILGSGATGRTAAVFAENKKAQVIMVSRQGPDNYQNLEKHYDAEIIINATPVGMYPYNEQTLIDLAKFDKCLYVFDAIYNPLKTRLLAQAEELQIPHQNGLAMLAAQGVKTAEIILDQSFPESQTEEIYRLLHKKMNNIILVGMPGSGKTTLGQEVAKLLKRDFYDSDREVFLQQNLTPAEIIAQQGEAEFRYLEKQVIKNISRSVGSVIATGGGAVLDPENISALKRNGTIIYLRRELSQLSLEDRPLSFTTGIEELYQQRKDYYLKAAQGIVDNDQEIPLVVQKIVEVYHENLASKWT